MKKNIGIWIDTKQAIIINYPYNSKNSVKKIESNIETRERVKGESKKFGRFGGQYLTYEKNRLNRKNLQTNYFIKDLIKEIDNCDGLVIFGPSKMKNLLEKEISSNMRLSKKLLGVQSCDLITENQMVAWVKNYFESRKS
ncbi:hypothetical protein [Lutibacter citreus]|uniref:hypothetical protein n=1 Tax=Lutibacter citreus TaxID=2138210 RepID=UPI000DBE9B4C|nr:hypothetical protein [Lutibacter citreus]